MPTDIRKLVRIQILVIVIFVLAKLIRGPILDTSAPEFIKIFLLSFPNFCEAIVGTITLTMIGFYINRQWLGREQQLKPTSIYLLSILLAAIYVISQEFKIHNLGGNNVYDPMDVVFSIIGLLVAYLMLLYIKPNSNS